MRIDIFQQYIPVGMGDIWQHEPFDAKVWSYPHQVAPLPCPADYVGGLLRGAVDGLPVTLPELDAALLTIGTTRAAVVAWITDQRREKV